jgi:hypothetical protein
MSRQEGDIRLRHMLDHAREVVVFDVLWQIVTHDLPPMVAALE